MLLNVKDNAAKHPKYFGFSCIIRAAVEKRIKKCNNFCSYLHLSITSANGRFLFSVS